jgi:hypothetical protein
MNIKNEFRDGSPIVVVLALRNGGRSTAVIDHWNVTTVLTPPDLPLNRTYRPGTDALRGPITPNGVDFETILGDTPIPAGATAELKASKRKLYVVGFINFADDYSFILSNRTIGFCYVYAPGVEQLQLNPQQQFNGCALKYSDYVYYE